jgi:hypothetical protein
MHRITPFLIRNYNNNLKKLKFSKDGHYFGMTGTLQKINLGIETHNKYLVPIL